ncbi:MAG TPA: hypothetical protein VHN11_09010 [Xanthobacteraceae bacterium]|nr:hypothetical protein [Xanthobacteraceae bacterium]
MGDEAVSHKAVPDKPITDDTAVTEVTTVERPHMGSVHAGSMKTRPAYSWSTEAHSMHAASGKAAMHPSTTETAAVHTPTETTTSVTSATSTASRRGVKWNERGCQSCHGSQSDYLLAHIFLLTPDATTHPQAIRHDPATTRRT